MLRDYSPVNYELQALVSAPLLSEPRLRHPVSALAPSTLIFPLH